MKKLVIILLSFFPIIGLAKNDYITLSCPTYDVGYTIECKLYTNTNYYINGVDYEFKLPKEVDVIEFNKDDIWQGELIDNKLYLYTDENQIGNVYLGKFKIYIKESISNIDIESVSLMYSDENFQDKKIDVNPVQIVDVKKNNNIYYVIIIIGIVLIIGLLIFILRRRKI